MLPNGCPLAYWAMGHRTFEQLVHDHCLADSAKPPWSRSEIQPIDDLALEALHWSKLSTEPIPMNQRFVRLRRIESTPGRAVLTWT